MRKAGRAGPAGAGKARGRRPRRRSALLLLARWAVTFAIWALVIAGGIAAWYAYDLPDMERLEAARRPPSVTLLDARGGVITTFGGLYGLPVSLKELPPHLPHAVLAMEDRRFYEHFGLDLVGLARAAFVNLREGRVRQGGSTITQQLAKNLFLTPERTLRRKVQETILALWLERKFTKDQILTLYLNRVYLGAGAYGVDAAARRYFAKAARQVTLEEAAMLAGLLKAPSRYNPLASPDLAAKRAKLALATMVDAGFVEGARARTAGGGPAPLAARPGGGGRYFADWVLDQVSDYVGYAQRDLVVATTLDPRLQGLAERKVAEALTRDGARRRIGQAALVAIDPSGAVRAMVGGRDYATSQFNRATQARRQPGSAFKPFVYLAALESGMGADDRLLDAPVSVGVWSPRNFGGRYHGSVTLREAMSRSLNSVAVRLSERVGRAKVIAAAHRLGVGSPLRPRPSVALGAGEVSLIELTAAYGAFANGGVGVWPHGIVEIREKGGRRLYRRAGSGPERVIQRRHAEAMNDLLGAVVARGTGRAAALGRPAAGKTGTSQDFRDAWFIGYTAGLVCGVWMGNDDDAPMNEVTGGGPPARLWRAFMAPALEGQPARPLPGLTAR